MAASRRKLKRAKTAGRRKSRSRSRSRSNLVKKRFGGMTTDADIQISAAISALRNNGHTTLYSGTEWYETQKFLLESIANIIKSYPSSDINHAHNHIESLNQIYIDNENSKLYQSIISALYIIESGKFIRQDADSYYASARHSRTLSPNHSVKRKNNSRRN